MTVRKNTQPASFAGDSGFAKIHALAATLQDLHRQKAATLAPIVQNLLHTHCRDKKEVEHTLDHLLDCACIPEGLALFKALIGFEVVVKRECRRARVEVKQAWAFDIRNLAFGISRADTFEERRVNP